MTVRVIGTVVVVVMIVSVAVAVIMTAAQHEGAGEIDAEAERRNRNRLPVDDGLRRDQPQDTFVGDLNSDQPENDGTGKGREIPELAGAEGEMSVAEMASREAIGKRRNPERGRMRPHMPAIGEQGHRPEQRAGHDLGHHHDQGQDDHDPGAPLVLVMLLAKERVIVRPLVEGM
jgi:hypothetical protein